MANPYPLSFGIEPKEYIKRPETFFEIDNGFSSGNPENRCIIITGVHGSGKTVFLSEISDYFRLKKIGLFCCRFKSRKRSARKPCFKVL